MNQATTPILVIGHVTRDFIDGEERLGGAAAYVALALRRCGRDVALVTRAPSESLLRSLAGDPHIRLHRLASDSFTTFRHYHIEDKRRLRLETRAAVITMEDIPSAWVDLPLVFLVPVMGECATEMLTAFPGSELIVGAQGWLRTAGPQGWVESCGPPQALLTARLSLVTLSEEDHPEAEALAKGIARNSRIVVLTRRHKPITVFEAHGQSDIPVEPIKRDRNAVGAGDVLTALLGLRMSAGDRLENAVRIAAQGAAQFVAAGMAGIERLNPN